MLVRIHERLIDFFDDVDAAVLLLSGGWRFSFLFEGRLDEAPVRVMARSLSVRIVRPIFLNLNVPRVKGLLLSKTLLGQYLV